MRSYRQQKEGLSSGVPLDDELIDWAIRAAALLFDCVFCVDSLQIKNECVKLYSDIGYDVLGGDNAPSDK